MTHVKWKYLLGILLFIAFSSLYIYTAPRGIYDGDTGELTTVIHTLGLAHPTGFPLYILSAKVFTLIFPFGDFAFRVNIYSALLTALAIAVFFLVLLELDLSMLSASLASLIFGLGSSIWSNAGVARVYPISLLFVVILLSIFVKWQKERKISFLYWYVLVWGISFGTHFLTLAMAWPLLVMMWLERAYLRTKPAILWKMAILFALPFVQYIYIPIAYARHQIITWGNIDSWGGFASYITQRQYVAKMFARSWDVALLFFKDTIHLLSSEFGIFLFSIGLVGLLFLYKKNRELFVVALLMSISTIAIMFAYGDEYDLYLLHRYFFVVYVVLAIGVAYGITALRSISFGRWALVGIVALFLVAEFSSNYTRNNRRDNFIVSDTAYNILEAVEPNSIIFVATDAAYGQISYLQSEQYRTDVILITPNQLLVDWYVKNSMKKYPDVFSPELLEIKGDKLTVNGLRMKVIVQDNISYRNIYAMFADYILPDNKTLANGFNITPIGILYKITPKGDDIKTILEKNDAIWSRYRLRNVISNTYDETVEENLRVLYRDALYNLGYAYFQNGLAPQAIDALRRSLEINYTPYAKDYLDFVESSH